MNKTKIQSEDAYSSDAYVLMGVGGDRRFFLNDKVFIFQIEVKTPNEISEVMW